MARRPGFLSLLKTVPEMVSGRNEFGVERGVTQRVVTGRIEWNLRSGNWKKIKRELMDSKASRESWGAAHWG